MTNDSSFPRVIDSTMINDFRRCPQLFYERYIACLKPAGESVDLVFGAAFAKGIEVARRSFYYEAFSPEQSIMRGANAALQEWGDFQEPIGHKKNLKTLLLAHSEYFEQWPISDPPYPLNPASIEYTFSHALPNIRHPDTGDAITYGGRFDMLGGDQFNEIYPVDEKTTGSPFFNWAEGWKLWGQFIGYIWACQNSGYPSVRKLLVRGIYINSTSNKFVQHFAEATDTVIARWLDDLQEDIERMIWMYNRRKFRRVFGTACKVYRPCPFIPLCEATKREDWVSMYEQSPQWNPLIRSGGEL